MSTLLILTSIRRVFSMSLIFRKKTEQLIEKKEKQSQELAKNIQEMQGAMQRAAVEAAKAMAAQQQQQVS